MVKTHRSPWQGSQHFNFVPKMILVVELKNKEKIENQGGFNHVIKNSK
jgi:hypothetical protein